MPSDGTFEKEFDAPLTQEEEAVLSQIEAKHTTVQSAPTTSPANSPTRKKRKRGASISPNTSPSPYKLRGSVKLTKRALNAGYKPNTSHIFRQDPSQAGDSTPMLLVGPASGGATSETRVGGKFNQFKTSTLIDTYAT